MAQAGAEVVTVLVVEDEPAILRLLAHALGAGELTVLLAGRGDEAVELYRNHKGGIDLVLLDVQMSPWDGPRTLAELRLIDPNVRVAFMSGNTGAYTEEELLSLGAMRLFTKPFQSLANLVAALRELIQAAAEQTNAVRQVAATSAIVATDPTRPAPFEPTHSA